jgi:N-acetylneuraminate synthase
MKEKKDSTGCIALGNKEIGPGRPPFIVAEMSGNHNQSLERAFSIVDKAAEAGAHAMKLQTYTADTLTIDVKEDEFFINDQERPWKEQWKEKSLYELYKKAYTPWEWHEPIFKRCAKNGLVAFSTPFDETAVDFLEELKVPAYKIASFENIHLQLIRKAASTGKPLIISTGMATISELDEAVRTARDAGCKDIILLKCTSTYPATPEDTNLMTIPHMRDLFHCEVGLSDHTMGIGAAVASVALGATLIEKHFTISREAGGPDASYSLEPDEMHSLVVETERAWKALGSISYGLTENERAFTLFRRSLYIVKDMMAGDILTADNLRVIRPGRGIAPKYFEKLLGKKVNRSVKRGTPMSWELLA